MNSPRQWFGATSTNNGKIYVTGGSSFVKDPVMLSSAEVYDTVSNKWTSLPNMDEKREGCAAVSIDGKVYVVGGYDEHQRYLASCEMFDPDTNRWTRLPAMTQSRSYCAACAIDNKL